MVGITIQTIQAEILGLENQKANALQIVERCEGALQLSRAWLGKLMREEDEARAAKETAEKAEADKDGLNTAPESNDAREANTDGRQE